MEDDPRNRCPTVFSAKSKSCSRTWSSSRRRNPPAEELLKDLEQFPPKKPARRRLADAIKAPFRGVGQAVSGINLPSVSAGHLLLAAIIIIVVAYVVGGTSDVWRYIIAGGVILFIAAFILSLRHQSRPPEKYWRDQPLDLRRRGGGSGRSGGWFGRGRNRR